MKIPARLLALILIFLTAPSTPAAPAHNIFDDDWTPPKATDAPHQPIKPITPPTADPTTPTPTPAKQPIPSKPDQAAVRKILKDIYAQQLIDRTPAARRKLTEALLAQAEKSAQLPADYFVLLAASIDAATDAGNLPLAFQAADKMGDAFDVDAFTLKAQTATKLNPKVASADAAQNISAGLDLATQLLSIEDYTTAARLCTSLQPLTAGDADLRAEVQKRQREVAAAKDAHEKITRDLEKLKTSPDDPAANLAVGRFTSFNKGDWPRGLPMLAKSSDSAIKALATEELAAPSATDEIVRLANKWWEFSTKQPDPASRAAVMAHAAKLYKQVVEKTEGLRQVQIQKRIEEASLSPGDKSWLVLFRSSDPAIWNTNTNDSPTHFAIELSRPPKDIQFLKLSAGETKIAIIPITQSQLAKQNTGDKYFWNGSNTKDSGGRHLGICDAQNLWGKTGTGINLAGGTGQIYFGWGFGHKNNVNDKQYFTWDRQPIEPTVFEIAVKAGPLTAKEKAALLK